MSSTQELLSCKSTQTTDDFDSGETQHALMPGSSFLANAPLCLAATAGRAHFLEQRAGETEGGQQSELIDRTLFGQCGLLRRRMPRRRGKLSFHSPFVFRSAHTARSSL